MTKIERMNIITVNDNNKNESGNFKENDCNNINNTITSANKKGESDTNCNWYILNGPQKLGNETGEIELKKNRETIKIS